jgi:homoserine dehydrogenase
VKVVVVKNVEELADTGPARGVSLDRPCNEPKRPAQQRPLAVLKFGHSVLQTVDHISIACNEIYRRLREGYSVIAVVSAIGDETSQLLKTGQDLFEKPDSRVLPKLLRIGEFRSSALMSLSLSRLGVNNHAVDPHEIGLLAEGDPLDSGLSGVDVPRLVELLAKHEVLVVPGFVANDPSGQLVALGRGGTDLTAVFLANATSADRLILFKDVDGVYAADPNASSDGRSERYACLDWEATEHHGQGLVQDKALQAAKKAGRKIEIAACARSGATLVGPFSQKFATQAPHSRLRVALLGLGTVGGGVYDHLCKYPDLFEVVRILVKDLEKHRQDVKNPNLLTDDPAELRKCEADLVIELIGGTDLAGDLVRTALRQGRDVVTANKALVANEFRALKKAAEKSGSEIHYSAAVGGGVPILEAVDRLGSISPVRRVEAIVNGTCNFVLGRLSEGDSLEEAVALAQEHGFAESDPLADLDGRDAAEKIAIIVRHAFDIHLPPQAIPRQSLNDLTAGAIEEARQNWKVLKQVCVCELEGDEVRAEVSLRAIDLQHCLANVEAEENGAKITLASGFVQTLSGKGAGRWPTAEAVMADVLHIWRLRSEAGERRPSAAVPAQSSPGGSGREWRSE